MTDEPQPEASPPRRWRTWHVVVAVVVALLIGVGIGASGSSDSDDDESVAANETSGDNGSSDAEPETTTTETPTTTVPESYVPAPGDFRLTVIETKKSCFGAAGCNVTYEVDLTYIGPRPLDPSDRWQVIYEIRGAEDPKVGSIEVQGDQYSKESETVSTASGGARLTATPTAVRQA